MDDSDLTKIGAGLYADRERRLYVNVREFMAAHNLPDTAEARKAVLEQIRRDFGGIEITELPDE